MIAHNVVKKKYEALFRYRMGRKMRLIFEAESPEAARIQAEIWAEKNEMKNGKAKSIEIKEEMKNGNE